MGSHKGRDSTYSKIYERFVWSCENCQKQGDLKLETNSKLHSIPAPSNVTKQVGADLCGLPWILLTYRVY